MVCRNLKDIPSAKRHTASHLREALGIARKAFVLKPGLRYSILLAAMLGLASFYPVWLIQPYMQSINVPLVWFGPIWAVANLCVSFGSLLSHRIQYHLGPRGTSLLLLSLIAIGYTGLAFNQFIWGFAFYFLLTIMRGIQGPFLRLALQKQSERHERASILSLKSLTFRLGFVITAPLIGMMADRSGLSFCFTILLITQVLLVAVLIWPFIKNTKTVWSS